MNSDDPETCAADMQIWKITLQHTIFVLFSPCWKTRTTQSYIESVTKIGKTAAYIHIDADNVHSYQLHTDM